VADVEKEFTVEGAQTWATLGAFLRSLKDGGGKWVVSIKRWEKLRTLSQNSRYWASLGEYMKQIKAVVETVSAETGYSPLEVRRLIADELPAEQVGILFAQKPETAHDILKAIVGCPTTTRLGTKEFIQFEERMEQQIAEIAGTVNAFARRAAA
jgi:hypothetical protein